MNVKHASLPDESDNALDRAIRAAMAQPPPEDVKNRVIQAAAAFAEHGHPSRVRIGVSHNHFSGKVKNMILAHQRLTATMAALLTLMASLILYMSLFSSSAPVYALEQTAEANQRITSYHIKVTPAPREEGISEAWVELNADGTPRRARMDIVGGQRGDRVVVLSGGRVEMWSRAKNIHMISNNDEMMKKGVEELRNMRSLFDPKLAFETVQADKAAGKVQVATKEPAKEGEPIAMTVTSHETPEKREVYEIDPKTKLVERVIDYRRSGDTWEQVSLREYLDYNQEIDPKVFQPELPKDIVTMDLTKNPPDLDKIGLAQGSLTDDEIATKLAKECFEAVIAGDWQKFGQLNDGIPGEGIKKILEQKQIRFLRIVEIGKPKIVKNPRASVKILGVPVKVEIETSGKKTIDDKTLYIRRVDRNSDRWSISGGF